MFEETRKMKHRISIKKGGREDLCLYHFKSIITD